MHRLTGHKSEPAGFCLKYAIGNRPVFGLFSADFSRSAPVFTDYIVMIRYHVICVEVFRLEVQSYMSEAQTAGS